MSRVTLHDALQYHDLGLCVIPIKHGTKKADCAWRQFQSTPPDEGQVRQWFGGDDRTAIGVIAGEVSGGLVCRDFDSMASYERWAADYPKLARALPTVATGRPGRHVYAKADIGEVKAVRGKATLVLDDGEVRAGGVSLLPPSRHPTGPDYAWLVPPSGTIPRIGLTESGLMQCNTVDTVVTVDPVNPSHVSTVLHPTMPTMSSDDGIAFAIASCLPTKTGQRNKMVFELARYLRAIPELSGAPVEALKPIVRQWHAAALPMIRTKEFDESWFDFTNAWPTVLYPNGLEPVKMIFNRALERDPPQAALQYELQKVRQLVMLCRELQQEAGDAPFFLACRTAADLVGIDYTTANRWLNGLCRDRVLELVERGTVGGRRANTYRYLGD